VQQARRAGRILGARGGARYRAAVEVFSAREKQLLLGERVVALGFPDAARDADAALAFDLGTYLPDDLLVKTDITSMSASLEARCPLLDHPLAEWVVPMGIESKQDRRRGKLMLEAATRDLLPAESYLRPKRGFGSPVDEWLRGPLRALFADTVLSARCRVGDWLDDARVRRVGQDVLEGRGNGHQAWALLALEQWARSVSDGTPGEQGREVSHARLGDDRSQRSQTRS
jgi:asparagine synthase (glutamine-hydrolysing)